MSVWWNCPLSEKPSWNGTKTTDSNITYPSQRIDSVRHLLADKEKQLNSIVDMLEMQEDVSKEIAQQVPAITRKIAQQPEKKKRGGFLGLFGKKSSHEASAEKSAALLHTLNNTVIAKQRQQSLQLAEFVDSLTARNGKLNLQLKELIKQMNAIAQQDLQQREQTIDTTKERGYLLIGGLTGFVLLMLLASYIVICRDTTRIRMLILPGLPAVGDGLFYSWGERSHTAFRFRLKGTAKKKIHLKTRKSTSLA